MKSLIRKILFEFLRHEIIVSSWGIEAIEFADDYIDFDVNGFKYSGAVHILVDKDQINIYLTKINLCLNNVNLFNLVEVLDLLIEKDENYYSNIFFWINDID